MCQSGPTAAISVADLRQQVRSFVGQGTAAAEPGVLRHQPQSFAAGCGSPAIGEDLPVAALGLQAEPRFPPLGTGADGLGNQRQFDSKHKHTYGLIRHAQGCTRGIPAKAAPAVFKGQAKGCRCYLVSGISAGNGFPQAQDKTSGHTNWELLPQEHTFSTHEAARMAPLPG